MQELGDFALVANLWNRGWVLMSFSPIEGVRFHASDNDSAEKVCPCSEVDIWCLFGSRFAGDRQSCCSNHNMEGP